jgi:hypothetical protein
MRISDAGALFRTLASCVALSALVVEVGAGEPEADRRETRIRAGCGRTIVAVEPNPAALNLRTKQASLSYPRPRLAGFSPLIAIATTDEGYPLGHDLEFEHELQSSYVGSPLNPAAWPGFIVGYLDSGADVNLAAGASAVALGLTGSNLTPNAIAIGGVGGTVDAAITMPVGFFAAGLAAVDVHGHLDYGALVGHSNVCALAAPPVVCGSGEVVTAVVGMPFVAFYNSIIRVDTPRKVSVAGVTYSSPDVQIQDPFDPLPTFTHSISMEFGGLSGVVTTANYYPDFFDLETPIIPTLTSIFAGAIPTGGAFFTTIYVLEGEPDPTNPAQPARVLVDTGAQSSILSSGMAANLSLPYDGDFSVSVCGVGGLVEGVPGHYVDYVKINAQGGALEFSRAPFVVLDLPSPEGGTLDGVLGMNFFWNRNVIFEPAVGSSAFLHVSEPIPLAYGDFDVDLDVDVDDVGTFVSCLTGPAEGMLSPDCDHVDGDEDADIDLIDFGRFQSCFSGDVVTADPGCGD